ncbi:MAG: FtsX-like permease family protein [Bacteroidetes bacterium]|nr:MAG: FtsX-like permease family protein [Bacteroidota bacterium]
MIRNYFKIAFRNLWRNKMFSVIKILGLGIGLTVCMLIFLYTKDEISYDRFHKNKAQLFRIIQTLQMGNNAPETIGITNGVIGEAFSKEIPEIQQFIRINGEPVTVKKNNNVFTENPLLVDDNFFTVFTFPLIEGSARSALTTPHSVVLSRNMARKYFGTEDVIGETMQIKKNDEFENYTVTALAENAPQNSTIKADMFLPIKYGLENRGSEWFGGSLNTFLLLSPQANLKTVESKMQAVFDKNTREMIAAEEKKQGITFKATLGLQPLTDIHLSKKAGPDNGMADGSKSAYSYILTCIAIFILVIACINFINLAVAQSLKRSKEIGIRKVVGSTRRQLIKQFLTESFFVSLISFLVAIVLTITILPFFNDLANKKLSLSYLSDGYLYAGYFLLLLVTSFISGFYPSLVLSAFEPVKVLYSRQKLMGKNYLTKGLIVLQFVLAIFLIIGTIIINSQLRYLLHKNLGYDSSNLVRIDLPFGRATDKLPTLFKNELGNQRNIISVAARNGGRSIFGAKANGKNIVMEYNRIDDQYLPTFKIPIIAGRNFSPDYPSDTMHSVIVNESFVKEAGWKLSNAVGQVINFMDEKSRQATIIGVIKDYHFTSLKEKITPELFSMDSTTTFYGQVWVKIGQADIPQTLSLLESTYKKLVPLFPYSYQFMDDVNAKNYETEAKWKQIISIASGLFVLISCMGLLGLVIISIEQRTKEIGIRKVLGAAVSKIVVLISKEFIILISIAFVIAVPVAYYYAHKWLQDFAYRITIDWWMFALAGVLVIVIALLTMSFKAIKAAVANPVKSLRTE